MNPLGIGCDAPVVEGVCRAPSTDTVVVSWDTALQTITFAALHATLPTNDDDGV